MVELRTFPGLAEVDGLVHGVTTRAGGVSGGSYASLNLGRGSGDEPASVEENGRRLAAALASPAPPRFPHQVHGRAVVVLEDRADGAPLGEADAVATARRGTVVGVLGADCPGVIVVDPRRRALAVVHSGWRGTLAGVVPAAVETLRRRFGSDGKDLRAGIGPGISAPRYEVGPEVAEAFRAGFPDADRCISRGRGDRSHLDIHQAIRLQLEAAGVPPEHVETMAVCTFDDSASFFSHRRDGPKTGRHSLVAVWAP